MHPPFVLCSLLCFHHPTISATALQDIFQHRESIHRIYNPVSDKEHNVFCAKVRQRTGDKSGRFAQGGKAKIPSFRRKQKIPTILQLCLLASISLEQRESRKNVENQDGNFSTGRNWDDNILTKRSIGHSGTHIYCYVHAAQTEERIGYGRVENGKVSTFDQFPPKNNIAGPTPTG